MAKQLILLVFVGFYITVMLLPSGVISQDMNGPPERPKVFKNPDELREYLKALNEYFAIVGRPRFGKRSEDYDRRADYTPLDFDGNGSLSSTEREYMKYLLFGYRK